MKLLIAAVLMLCATAAHAQHSLVLHGLSKHHSPHPEHNEQNWGGGYRYTSGTLSGEAGAFKNTYRRWSPYIGVEWLPLTIGPVSGGAGIIAATNYPEDKVKVINGVSAAPFIAVRLQATKNLSLSLRTIPARNGVTELSAGWTFK